MELYRKLEEGQIKKSSIIAGAINVTLTLEEIRDRLKNSPLALGNMDIEEDTLYIGEDGNDLISIYIDETYSNELYKLNHYVPQETMDLMKDNKYSIFIDLKFGENHLESYLYQLELLTIAVPELILVVDLSSEKFLSKEWVFMTVREKLLPSPAYLYSIQGVVDDKDNVWLHTHGLNRCGMIELEILGANRENSNTLYQLLEATAHRFLSSGMTKEDEILYLGRNIVLTWKPWEVEVERYQGIIGEGKDRENHDDPSGVLYLYQTPNDYENKILSHVEVIVPEIEDNPVFFYSNEESLRMATMAISRFNYLKDTFANKENNYTYFVKLGLEVDEDKVEEIGEKEHLWFGIKDITDKNEIVGELINEPYGIKDLKSGDIVTKHSSYLTDWLIRTEQTDVNPDSVYILFYL